MIFLLKANMIETKANFQGKYLNYIKCEICGEEETTQHLFECDGYPEIRKNIKIEDTPMKTLRRNNIKTIAEVLSRITEKRSMMEENKIKNKMVTIRENSLKQPRIVVATSHL